MYCNCVYFKYEALERSVPQNMDTFLTLPSVPKSEKEAEELFGEYNMEFTTGNRHLGAVLDNITLLGSTISKVEFVTKKFWGPPWVRTLVEVRTARRYSHDHSITSEVLSLVCPSLRV